MSPAVSSGPPLVVSIVGPTASGKSGVALLLAQELCAEIVSTDAFQVYRGMDIGTAKVPHDQRLGIPHHLIDILDVTQALSVAEYQARGRAVLADIAARGRPAVLVGGSGLYVRGLLDDLTFPGSDPAVRKRWQAQCDRVGAQEMHRILAEVDPAAAAVILPSNGRRIVRALEVNELTGQPFRAELPKSGPSLIPHVSFGLEVARELLDERIAKRVWGMIEAGWPDEVSELVRAGLERSSTAGKALGYAEIMDSLSGRMSLQEAGEQVIRGTRRYARRQQRWFHGDPRTTWFPADDSSTVPTILSHLRSLPRNLWT